LALGLPLNYAFEKSVAKSAFEIRVKQTYFFIIRISKIELLLTKGTKCTSKNEPTMGCIDV